MKYLIGLILLIITCASLLSEVSFADVSETETLYGLELSADSTQALIYIDGKFKGQTSSRGPLRIILNRARVQLRATESGHLDFIQDLVLQAGKVAKFTLKMKKHDQKWKVPSKPTILRVGQVTRGHLAQDAVMTYRIEESRSPHRLIQGFSSLAEFTLKDSDGKMVALKKIPRVAGTPGKWFFEYKGSKPGTYTREVRSTKGHFAFELSTGLPELIKSDDPVKKGRRKLPQGPR